MELGVTIEAKLEILKNKLKKWAEEKAWYTEANPILDVFEYDLKMRLAMFLIDLLEPKAEKAKHKCKLNEEQHLADEQEKERKQAEEQQQALQQYHQDWIAEQESETFLATLYKRRVDGLHFSYSSSIGRVYFPTPELRDQANNKTLNKY